MTLQVWTTVSITSRQIWMKLYTCSLNGSNIFRKIKRWTWSSNLLLWSTSHWTYGGIVTVNFVFCLFVNNRTRSFNTRGLINRKFLEQFMRKWTVLFKALDLIISFSNVTNSTYCMFDYIFVYFIHILAWKNYCK